MLTLRRPYRDWTNWGREFDDLLSWSSRGGQAFSPAVDIEEQDDAFVLQADLPGISEKEIEINIHDGILLLSGKREQSKKEEQDNVTLRERRYGAFQRQFRLGPHVDASKIAATYKNGVLTVTLPKAAEAKPRQIPVKNN